MKREQPHPRGMRATRTSWTTKLRPEQEPRTTNDPRYHDKLLIPTPMLLAAEISRVPKGRLVTPERLRDVLARRFGADRTCPLTTGIFLNIIAGAAEEDLAAGRPAVAPYWRVVKENGSLNPKFPPGPERQAEHLRAEGHRVSLHGKALRVEEFQDSLAKVGVV